MYVWRHIKIHGNFRFTPGIKLKLHILLLWKYHLKIHGNTSFILGINLKLFFLPLKIPFKIYGNSRFILVINLKLFIWQWSAEHKKYILPVILTVRFDIVEIETFCVIFRQCILLLNAINVK